MRINLLHRKSGHSSAYVASIFVVVSLCFMAWALVPVLLVLLRERQLSDTVLAYANQPDIAQSPDWVYRTRIQQLARKQGFHMEFQDIFVEYQKSSQEAGMPPPSTLGYTLRMELPFFGFANWPMIALRTHMVGEKTRYER